MLDFLKKLAAKLAGEQARKPATAPSQSPRPKPLPAQDIDFVDSEIGDILDATRRQADRLLDGRGGGGPEWEAKYPDFAINDGKELPASGVTDEVRDEEDETPWLQAPATSNILEMKIADATRPTETLTRAQQQTGTPAPVVILIRFKPSPYGKSAGQVREYEYYFDSRSQGRAVWNELKSSPHPWGEVGYPRLVQARVPYQRIR